jgi:hypothetical protein
MGASNLVGDSRWARAELLACSTHWSSTGCAASFGGEVFRDAAWRAVIGVVKRHRLNAVERIATYSATTTTSATATSAATTWAVLTECSNAVVAVWRWLSACGEIVWTEIIKGECLNRVSIDHRVANANCRRATHWRAAARCCGACGAPAANSFALRCCANATWSCWCLGLLVGNLGHGEVLFALGGNTATAAGAGLHLGNVGDLNELVSNINEVAAGVCAEAHHFNAHAHVLHRTNRWCEVSVA